MWDYKSYSVFINIHQQLQTCGQVKTVFGGLVQLKLVVKNKNQISFVHRADGRYKEMLSRSSRIATLTCKNKIRLNHSTHLPTSSTHIRPKSLYCTSIHGINKGQIKA